jgi:hypothetical protein
MQSSSGLKQDAAFHQEIKTMRLPMDEREALGHEKVYNVKSPVVGTDF